jgi:phenylalanyl-tRNA synthetase beta chain
MKFTFSWLKEFLETDNSHEEIVNALNMIGLEVEEVINQEDKYKNFIVAEIISVIPHPEADKLQICQVNNGKETLQIVCGAPNARAGIKVILAPIGVEIPTNGLKIKESKIRNVKSFGMLCSAKELDLGVESDGIMELDNNLTVGIQFSKAYGLNEILIDISITPNRGDCLGIYGIARDLAAAGYGKLIPLNSNSVKGTFSSPINVKLETPEICPKYIGRYFKEIKNSASPKWLEEKLKSIGVNSISSLVDITNYFTFTFGRPLHVYDADLIKGDLVVRNSKKNEEIIALNDKKYLLNSNEGIISDDEKILSIAGIIGGKDTGVSETTKNIFLEIGFFDADIAAKTGRLHQIDTDSKYRLERKIDPEFMQLALDMASKMIMDLCSGRPSDPIIIDQLNFKENQFDFSLCSLKKKIGIEYEKSHVKNILLNLGFKIEDNGEIFKLTVPSWRPDITAFEDIVEEIARIDGYDNITSIPLPLNKSSSPSLDSKQRSFYRLPRFAASLGLTEAVTFSFMHSEKAKLFTDLKDELHLKHPISIELDYMRPSIIPNLLEAALKNQNRGIENIALFEMGSIFEGIEINQQKQSLAGLRSGYNNDRNIYNDHRRIDIFDSKQDILNIISELGIDPSKPQISTKNLPKYYHPGRAACLSLGKNILGYFGQLHPKIIKNYDLNNDAVAFELFLDNMPIAKSKFGRKGVLKISDYQAVKRDFSFLVDKEIQIDQITRSIAQIDKKLIKTIDIFDIYAGKGIEDDKKSVAITVTIQALDRTLQEEEIESLSSKIIDSVIKNTGAALRGV